MINLLVDCYGSDKVVVCGPTGMSALNVNGRTLHSTFKIDCNDLSKELSRNQHLSLESELDNIHMIIIDEKSMVSAELLYTIHSRLQKIKKCEEIFGGLHMLLIGDFGQLPPINSTSLLEAFGGNMRKEYNSSITLMLNTFKDFNYRFSLPK